MKIHCKVAVAPFMRHWGLHDLEIAAQLHDPKNVQRNLKVAQIGKSHVAHAIALAS